MSEAVFLGVQIEAVLVGVEELRVPGLMGQYAPFDLVVVGHGEHPAGNKVTVLEGVRGTRHLALGTWFTTRGPSGPRQALRRTTRSRVGLAGLASPG